MNINSEVVVNAIKKALESYGVKSIPGVNIDDLVKSIAESVIKSLGDSVDVKSIGDGIMKNFKSVISKDK